MGDICLEMRQKSRHATCVPSEGHAKEEDATMAAMREEMDRRIDEHFAFEARDDVEGVLATLSPDIEHDIVGWPAGPTRGREAARPFYEALFADLAESR